MNNKREKKKWAAASVSIFTKPDTYYLYTILYPIYRIVRVIIFQNIYVLQRQKTVESNVEAEH